MPKHLIETYIEGLTFPEGRPLSEVAKIAKEITGYREMLENDQEEEDMELEEPDGGPNDSDFWYEQSIAND